MRANGRTKALLAVLAALVVLAAGDSALNGGWLEEPPQAAGKPDSQDRVAQTVSGKEAGERFALPARAPLGESRGDLFGSQSRQPPPPKVVAAPPPKPVAPPMPYKFAGRAVREGVAYYYLAKDDSVFTVHEGDVLDGSYRVESIEESKITLVYIPLKEKQTIPVFTTLPAAERGNEPRLARRPSVPAASPTASAGSSASAGSAPGTPVSSSTVIVLDGGAQSRPAQLQLQGPLQVKLGSRFEVTLKVTSGQPLQATPMQLRFDPKYLQFVTAKPGKLFASEDRQFSYRVNADGSLFVGASSRNPVPVTDAELIVLVFQPVRPAPAAELSVASLSLQGPAGRPIIASHPQAFKTVITP